MRPPIIWQEPPADWAAELRGRTYFRGLALGMKMRRQELLVQVATGPGYFAMRRGTVIFRYMPHDIIPGYGLVADVTADVLGLMPEPTQAMRAAHDARATVESSEFWRRPDILAGHAKALRSAVLITTSWAELVDPLADFADCPVVHVPDYHGLWGRAFRRGMRQVWRELEAAQELR